ncbi:proline-rich protein 5-like isoform X2 [Corvus hawaiiensis]|uniref:proline-rich protein 5-like isoform X2 n=1 Tax=Corvus kubaryi TaxID=68294 RepID=UPI001C03B749|nr:proline-rich protein 5-like isoform X2 [Corvus kubaryi]XP_048164090.1 proline-rich protein 5-like isoform X2 [Corvus hawaiiensis]
MKGGFTIAPSFVLQFHKMGSFRRPRPRFMSSPVLSDLPRFQAARQAMQLSSNSAWNSVQTAVINVFKGGGLQNNELYTLNEHIRTSSLRKACCLWRRRSSCVKVRIALMSCLKSGITILQRLFLLSRQYSTQSRCLKGQELTIRQIALLGFRDLVLLKVKLEEILPLVQTKLPASIVQMLLILQSVHEPTGPTEGYLQLEELVKQVVSPFLGLCEDHSSSGSTCLLERRYSRSRPKALTPLTEQEGEAYLEKCGSIRRHTVANAHSDIQLLAMASMMHTGMVIEESDTPDKCLLLQPSCFSHRQCSSEPSIADGPEGVVAAASRQDPAELNCTSVS